MSSRLIYCANKNLCTPPKWLKDTLIYEAITGSHSYGCNISGSDEDVIGICIPPRKFVLPWSEGIIPGFQDNPYKFEQYEGKKIACKDSGKEWDITVYNIIKFFNLAYENNPNFLDYLFVPQTCITMMTQAGQLIRDNRKLFLSKLCIPKFRNYSRSQIGKMENKNPIGKRKELVDKFGFDVKYAGHLIRLILQCEQILIEEDLDLVRNSQTLKGIRSGEWSKERVLDFYYAKEAEIENSILKSTLRAKPDEVRIKELLLECLEIQYGKITDKIIIESPAVETLKQIHALAGKILNKE